MFTYKTIKLIAAVSLNNVIGCNDGSLPFAGLVPSDVKRFRKLTSESGSNSVVMGRKTWESIPEQFRPLPDRCNIVVSRNQTFWLNGHSQTGVAHSIEEAFQMAPGKTVWVIGGSEIYNLALPYLDEAHITNVEGFFIGEVQFPFKFDGKEWRVGMVEKNYSSPDKISSTYTVYHRLR